MSKQMSKRARLEATFAGAAVDRPPVALWRHWPVDDLNGHELARATLAFQRTYDFDFIKLIWSPNLYDDTRGQRRAELKGAIQGIGAERVVLCRCDSEMAIVAGEELGISLYQGRLIDSLLQQRPAIEAAKPGR